MLLYHKKMDVKFLISHSKALSMTSKDIISYNAEYGVKTRAQTAVSTASCRLWQLILAILDQLKDIKGYDVKTLIQGHSLSLSETDKTLKQYNAMVAKISTVLDNIRRNPTLDLLIYSNQIVPGEIVMYDPRKMKLQNGKNYLCIYIEGAAHSILHYFTIIQTTDGKQYLNSSYGSDYVCVSQYTTELVADELNRFISALNNPDTDEDYISEFYKKYFLKGNIGVSYSEDDYENNPSLRFAKIVPDEGNLREIASVTENQFRNKIRCGIMPNYGGLVGSVIGSSYIGGRRRKTAKKHSRRHNKTSRRHNKTSRRHNKTKRHRSSNKCCR